MCDRPLFVSVHWIAQAAVAAEMLTAGSVDDALKEAWAAILKGDNAAVRAWVAGCVDWSHPIAASEYELHADGQVHLGTARHFDSCVILIDRALI